MFLETLGTYILKYGAPFKNMGPPMTNDTYLPPKPTFAIENEIGMIVLLTFADVHLNLTEKFYFVEI